MRSLKGLLTRTLFLVSLVCVGVGCAADQPVESQLGQAEESDQALGLAPVYQPCAGSACGERCQLCSPWDPDCLETAVIKYCQADGSCSPRLPLCKADCATILCAVGTHCESGTCVPDVDACAAIRCAAGTHCEAGTCVPDKVFCGGIAAFPCPGDGRCVDDPSDDCDPRKGGADCGGICRCKSPAIPCPKGFHFDLSPHVCGCVRDQPLATQL